MNLTERNNVQKETITFKEVVLAAVSAASSRTASNIPLYFEDTCTLTC